MNGEVVKGVNKKLIVRTSEGEVFGGLSVELAINIFKLHHYNPKHQPKNTDLKTPTPKHQAQNTKTHLQQ